MGLPFTNTAPFVGKSAATSSFISVDLPAPFGPNSPTRLGLRRERLTPSRARLPLG